MSLEQDGRQGQRARALDGRRYTFKHSKTRSDISDGCQPLSAQPDHLKHPSVSVRVSARTARPPQPSPPRVRRSQEPPGSAGPPSEGLTRLWGYLLAVLAVVLDVSGSALTKAREDGADGKSRRWRVPGGSRTFEVGPAGPSSEGAPSPKKPRRVTGAPARASVPGSAPGPSAASASASRPSAWR